MIQRTEPRKPEETQKDGPLRRVRAEALFDLVQTSTGLSKLEGIRYLAGELERLDAEGVPGLTVRGLGTQHLFRNRLREQEDRWTELGAAAAKARLLRAAGNESGGATRYLELDAALEPDDRPLLGLLAPSFLAKGGFDEILREAQENI